MSPPLQKVSTWSPSRHGKDLGCRGDRKGAKRWRGKEGCFFHHGKKRSWSTRPVHQKMGGARLHSDQRWMERLQQRAWASVLPGNGQPLGPVWLHGHCKWPRDQHQHESHRTRMEGGEKGSWISSSKGVPKQAQSRGLSPLVFPRTPKDWAALHFPRKNGRINGELNHYFFVVVFLFVWFEVKLKRRHQSVLFCRWIWPSITRFENL